MKFASFKARMTSTAIVASLVIAGYSGTAWGQTSGPVYTTTGVYDENEISTATVNAEAVGNNISLADFTTAMATAWTNNAGGVINFDLVSAPSELTNRFFATYGESNQFLFAVTRNDLDGSGGGLNTNSNEPNRISGANYLGISNGANYDITFSTPLIQFGITALSRGADRTGRMTIRFSDGSTPYAFPVETVLAAADNTFFGYDSSLVGKFISGVSWTSFNSAIDLTPNDGNFVRFDDLGFSTSNLAPCDVDGINGCTTADADIIRQNLLATGASRTQGDITGDGRVDLLDFKLWKSLAGSGSGGLSSVAVPEPASLAMLLLAAVLGIGSRRTRR